MNRMVNTIFSLGITTKLVVLFAIFGIVPMAAVGYLGSSATGEMETAAGLRVQAMAETIGDKIDRNLFERYGDPQSFALNRIVGERYHWYRQFAGVQRGTGATSGLSSGKKTSGMSQPIQSVKAASPPKSTAKSQPVGVGSSNGHDRRQRENDFFEEF